MGLLLSGKNPAAYKTVERVALTATAGQTVFTVPNRYQVGDIDVFLNGIRLVDVEDYYANDGKNIVLLVAAAAGDHLLVTCYNNFLAAGHYTKTESDSRYLGVGGTTPMTSYLRTPNYGVTSTSDSASVSLEASAFAGEQGVGIKAFGRSAITNGGGILYTADNRGASGAHKFGFWNGTSFTTTMQIDSSGRMTVPNQPLFQAYVISGTGTYTGTISYNATKITNPAWNNTRFTAQIAGYYYFSWTGFMQNSSSGSNDIALNKNGAQYVRTYSNEATGVYRPYALSAIMRLEVGEYCESYSGIELHQNQNMSFCGFLIG